MTNFNERTNTLLYKNISLTLYSKGLMLVVCERWVGDGDRLLHIDPKFFFDHSSTSFSSWLGLLNRGSLRTTSPQSASWFSRWHLVPQLTPTPTGTATDPSRLCPGYIFVWRPHDSAVLRLFTQVHLLIDGSVEGQYITLSFLLG